MTPGPQGRALTSGHAPRVAPNRPQALALLHPPTTSLGVACTRLMGSRLAPPFRPRARALAALHLPPPSRVHILFVSPSLVGMTCFAILIHKESPAWAAGVSAGRGAWGLMAAQGPSAQDRAFHGGLSRSPTPPTLQCPEPVNGSLTATGARAVGSGGEPGACPARRVKGFRAEGTCHGLVLPSPLPVRSPKRTTHSGGCPPQASWPRSTSARGGSIVSWHAPSWHRAGHWACPQWPGEVADVRKSLPRLSSQTSCWSESRCVCLLNRD